MANPVCTSSTLPALVNQGVHTRAYLVDKHLKSQEMVNIRCERQLNPGWNTLKEVVWAPLMSFFQLGQAIGSFSGHLVVALPAALLGSGFGLCVYAPCMKAVDLIIGRETRPFFEYAIKPANLLSNIAYNRVTDFLSRYVLGPALLVSIVEPVLFLGVSAAVGVALSPLIYRDFAYNNSRNVEYFIDNPLMTSVKWSTFHHGWQKFDDLAAGKPKMTIYDRVAARIHANQVDVNLDAPALPSRTIA